MLAAAARSSLRRALAPAASAPRPCHRRPPRFAPLTPAQSRQIWTPASLPRKLAPPAAANARLTIASKFSAVAEEISAVHKPVAYWLLGTAGVVAGMVLVGGITRLTRSGLSMTDWKIYGNLPPMNQAEWEAEFERYKQFPEWQQRKNMTLDEFKYIYFWEYGHRQLGRALGFVFAGPAVYFAFKRMIPRAIYPLLGGLFTLGFGQGLIGWWMVKSGLEMDPQQRKEIRVSPYRLATHLAMAFTTYTGLIYTALQILNPTSKMQEIASKLSPDVLRKALTLRRFALLNSGLIAVTVLSGAFVAGNDAGRAYNTFPKMLPHAWIPDEIMEMEPKWRNFFENVCTVQFNHRVLAMTTFTSIMSMYAMAHSGGLWKQLPKQSRVAMHAIAGMAATQVTLGLGTLLMYVPIPLAAAHQTGALVLLTLTTWAANSLKFAKLARVARII